MALDLDPEKARPWIDAASPTHPALIDRGHITNELFGFHNVPMAVWIDESGTLVRPAESASVEKRESMGPLPDDLPARIKDLIDEAQQIPDIGERYRAAVLDWVERGADSPYALSPDQVVSASHPRGRSEAEAAANFELGRHLHDAVGKDAAVPYWRAAHTLDPDNWTYKRQAWTLETTPEGQPSDLMQPPTELYEGNWLDDVKASGGGANYLTKPAFID